MAAIYLSNDISGEAAEQDIEYEITTRSTPPIKIIDNSDIIIKDKVIAILKNGPLNFLVDTCQEKHKGDTTAIITFLLSAISAHPFMDVKLNIAVLGDSDVGKTDAILSVYNLIDESNKYHSLKVSPKVLYYEANNGYSFLNKLILIDDIDDNDTEILKNIANTSNKPPTFSTMIKQKPVRLTFDAVPVVCTTKIKFVQDEQQQLDRRFYSVEIIETSEEKLNKITHISEMLSNNLKTKETENEKIAKQLLSIIMNSDYYVEVPPFELPQDLTKSGVHFLYAMIRSFAKINLMKRIIQEFEDGTKHILAQQEDIDNAITLYKQNKPHQLKITKRAQYILDKVPNKMPDPDAVQFGAMISPNSIKSIYEEVKDWKYKITMRILRDELTNLYDTGLIDIISGGRNNAKFYYRL